MRENILNMSHDELFQECQSRGKLIGILKHDIQVLEAKNKTHDKRRRRQDNRTSELENLVDSERGQRKRANKLECDNSTINRSLALAIQKYNELAASSR